MPQIRCAYLEIRGGDSKRRSANDGHAAASTHARRGRCTEQKHLLASIMRGSSVVLSQQEPRCRSGLGESMLGWRHPAYHPQSGGRQKKIFPINGDGGLAHWSCRSCLTGCAARTVLASPRRRQGIAFCDVYPFPHWEHEIPHRAVGSCLRPIAGCFPHPLGVHCVLASRQTHQLQRGWSGRLRGRHASGPSCSAAHHHTTPFFFRDEHAIT